MSSRISLTGVHAFVLFASLPPVLGAVFVSRGLCFGLSARGLNLLALPPVLTSSFNNVVDVLPASCLKHCYVVFILRGIRRTFRPSRPRAARSTRSLAPARILPRRPRKPNDHSAVVGGAGADETRPTEGAKVAVAGGGAVIDDDPEDPGPNKDNVNVEKVKEAARLEAERAAGGSRRAAAASS